MRLNSHHQQICRPVDDISQVSSEGEITEISPKIQLAYIDCMNSNTVTSQKVLVQTHM